MYESLLCFSWQWSLRPAHRSPTKCDVSECDPETSSMRRPRPVRAVEPRRNTVCIFSKEYATFIGVLVSVLQDVQLKTEPAIELQFQSCFIKGNSLFNITAEFKIMTLQT